MIGIDMSISTTLEYWNEAPEPSDIHVIIHSRKEFYNGKDIMWYEFSIDETALHELGHEDVIPEGFQRVVDTKYYEFGGTNEEALNTLNRNGFTLIIYGRSL